MRLHTLVLRPSVFAAALLALAAVACSDPIGSPDTVIADASNEATGADGSTPDAPPTDANIGDASDTDSGPQPPTGDYRGLSRLTPEQISNQLEMALGVQLAAEDPRYNFDLILAPDFAIPLGGVDFRIASERNHETRLQTLLVSRALAWLSAITFLGAEFATPNIVTCQTICIPTPSLDGVWAAQAQDLHWRIFNRAAEPDELQDIATLYSAALAQEQFPILAWNAVIFAFLSTAEFWHR